MNWTQRLPPKVLGVAAAAIALCAGALWLFLNRREAPTLRVSVESNLTARRRVLFVGDSRTSWNDLPGCVAKLDPTLATASVTAPSETLQGHLEAEVALDAIRTRDYEHVVLQERGVQPLISAGSFQASLQQFVREIRRHGAAPVLFETWEEGNDTVHQARDDASTDLSQRLAREFASAAEALQMTRAPVGLAFALAELRLPGTALVSADGRHPSEAGTYLAACVIVEAITKQAVPESSSGCFPSVDAIAPKLSGIADEIFTLLEHDLPNGSLCRSEESCAKDNYCAAPIPGERGLCVTPLDSGARWEALVGKWVGVQKGRIVVESGPESCTHHPCRPTKPCCNVCSKRTGFRQGDQFAELAIREDGPGGNNYQSKPCVRPACQEFADCEAHSQVSFWGRLRKDMNRFRIEAEVVHND